MQGLGDEFDGLVGTAGAADQFVLADDAYQIMDQLSKNTLIMLVFAIIEDFGLNVIIANKLVQDILVGDIKRMSEDIECVLIFGITAYFVDPFQVAVIGGFIDPLIIFFEMEELQIGIFAVIRQVFIDTQHEIAGFYGVGKFCFPVDVTIFDIAVLTVCMGICVGVVEGKYLVRVQGLNIWANILWGDLDLIDKSRKINFQCADKRI